MAYTDIATQIIIKGGLEPAYVAATLSEGDKFRNTGKEFLHVINGGGANPCVVTMVTQAQIKGLDIQDKTVSVPFGEDRMLGPFEPGLYNQATGQTDAGKTYIEYDQVTSVTVAIIRM